jgi:hypothetical protein
VFAALEDNGTPHVWVSRADGSDPQRVTDREADSPRFDVAGNIYYRGAENGLNFIYRVGEDGTPEKALQQPVLFFLTASPRGDWLIARVQMSGQGGSLANLAFPISGGTPVRLCDECEVDWSPSGNALLVRLQSEGEDQTARTFVIALAPGTTLPPWPERGIESRQDVRALHVVDDFERWVYPSANPTTYVFLRSTIERNIHRVLLP